jgi:hypothetical protein
MTLTRLRLRIVERSLSRISAAHHDIRGRGSSSASLLSRQGIQHLPRFHKLSSAAVAPQPPFTVVSSNASVSTTNLVTPAARPDITVEINELIASNNLNIAVHKLLTHYAGHKKVPRSKQIKTLLDLCVGNMLWDQAIELAFFMVVKNHNNLVSSSKPGDPMQYVLAAMCRQSSAHIVQKLLQFCVLVVKNKRKDILPLMDYHEVSLRFVGAASILISHTAYIAEKKGVHDGTA